MNSFPSLSLTYPLVNPHRAGLAAKYCTSKISGFEDLDAVATFGFRGEALSSLCALADVAVVTRTHADTEATRLEFDHTGKIIREETAARAVGCVSIISTRHRLAFCRPALPSLSFRTTVSLRGLFKTLPVRHKDFIKNLKRDYAKLILTLQAGCSHDRYGPPPSTHSFPFCLPDRATP